jgi:flagellar biosynthesis GTPase FlhF
MAGRIFINYRREDSRADARSVYQRLERVFGKNRLFMDVDTIQKGRDFTKVLDEHLAQSDVMLAVIGNRWLTAQDEQGARRLDDPADFVRVEIARALDRDIAVIPVLVDGAKLPKASDLPDELKPLSRRQASIVTHENFGSDVEGLARDLKAMQRPGVRHRWLGGAIAAALLLAIAGYGASVWIEAAREATRQAVLDEQRKAAEAEAARQAAAQQKAAEEAAARQAAEAEAARLAALQKAAEEEAARQAAAQKAAEEAAKQAAPQTSADVDAQDADRLKAAQDLVSAWTAAPAAVRDDVPEIIVGKGEQQRFDVKTGQTAELTSSRIPIVVSQSDGLRERAWITIAGGETSLRLGQQIGLGAHGGGNCKLTLFKVTDGEATFDMGC